MKTAYKGDCMASLLKDSSASYKECIAHLGNLPTIPDQNQEPRLRDIILEHSYTKDRGAHTAWLARSDIAPPSLGAGRNCKQR